MSGIEALSLACNILQLIGYAKDTIVFCKKVYDGASPDGHLNTSATTLKTLSDEIYSAGKFRTSPSPAQRRLQNVSERCSEAARALGEESKFLVQHAAKGTLRSTLALAAKANWRKKRLERLEKELKAHQELLDSNLLARLCTQGDALQAQQTDGFTKLNNALQSLVASIATGRTENLASIQSTATQIRVDMRREAERTNQTVTTTVSQAQVALQDHITNRFEALKVTSVQTWEQTVRDGHAQRLLRSLKFSGMNARQNQLDEPAGGTYRWIFGSSGRGYSSTDEHEDDSDTASVYDSDLGGPEPPQSWDHFADWLKSDSQVYWISGKPGSGKSTLVKFIAQHPQTRENLAVWRPDCTVLSYYFWKAGSLLQQSLRGLRLTLLHQLLASDSSSLKELGLRYRTFDEQEDWSSSDLDIALFATLQKRSHAACLFLDGLDEICTQDGHTGIVDLISRLQTLPRVKLCISSRPERLFEASFGREQHLKLQDLTFQDMKRTARQALRPHFGAILKERSYRIEDLTHSVCLRAEGVFLWLKLALGDLITGMTNGDSYAQLHQRLEQLPTELEDLYWDMWNRLNSSSSSRIYRQTAAAMLKSLLAFRELRGTGPQWHPLTLFELRMVTHPRDFPHDGLASNLTIRELQLQDCQGAVCEVQVMAAGLVQFRDLMGPDTEDIIVWDRQDTGICRPKLLGFGAVEFAHRSAYDFLTKTVRGQLLLSYDRTTLASYCLQLIKARLALVHVDLGYLASLFAGTTSEIQWQRLNFANNSAFRGLITSLADTGEFPSTLEREAVLRTHLEYLNHHKHLGMKPEVFLSDCLFHRDNLLEHFAQTSLADLPQSERQRTATWILQLLCFAGDFGNPLAILDARLSGWDLTQTDSVAVILHDLGADFSVSSKPRPNSGIFLDSSALSIVSPRHLLLSRVFLRHQYPYSHTGSCQGIGRILEVCVDGSRFPDLAQHTLLVLSVRDMDYSLSSWRFGQIMEPGRIFSVHNNFLLLEMNITFIMQSFISCGFQSVEPRAQALFKVCPPVFHVRYYGLMQVRDKGRQGPCQLYGPLNETFDRNFKELLMPLLMSREFCAGPSNLWPILLETQLGPNLTRLEEELRRCEDIAVQTYEAADYLELNKSMLKSLKHIRGGPSSAKVDDAGGR